MHPSRARAIPAFLLLAACLPTGPAAVRAGETGTERLSVTVRAVWSDCDGDCDRELRGNRVNSGSYTINISGTVKPSGGSAGFVSYEPSSLTGTCSLQSTENDVTDPDCRACNPVETVRGSRTVTFGREENAVAFLQAFLGSLGAGFVQQLTGELGPGYEKTLPTLAERRVVTFAATGPVDLSRTRKDCGSCAASTENLPAGFAVSINADMTTRRSGSVSWTSRVHPMDAPGATVIDLGGRPKTAPEEDSRGRARFTVTWSLGEAEPARLELKELSFNYPGNAPAAVTLRSHRDDSEITAPEWTAAGVRKPAAFVRDSAFRVKAVFGVSGDRMGKAEIWTEEEAEGAGGKGFGGLGKQTVSFAPGEREKEVEFDVRSPQRLIGVNSVKWSWRANIWYQGAEEPAETGIGPAGGDPGDPTEHIIYIVAGKTAVGATPYEYAVKLGCRWAEGKSTPTEAFPAIWEGFWDIPCPEDTPCSGGVLAYGHGDAPATTGGLLREGRGKCGAWQGFLADVAGSQGLALDKVTIRPKEELGIETMIVGRGAAQGNVDPNRNFNDHAVVRHEGWIWDPSYHSREPVGPLEELSVYENETFVAYCSREFSEACLEKCGGPGPSRAERADCFIRHCDCRGNDPLACEVRGARE